MIKTTMTAAALCAGVLVPATSAAAWSASASQSAATFSAAPGEVNKTQVSQLDPVMLRLTDVGGPVGFSSGCGWGNGVADCPIRPFVRLYLNDKSDTVLTGDALVDTAAQIDIAGMTGNDTISNGAMPGKLDGDEGSDIVRPGKGDDVVDGGAGLDAVDYTDRSAPVKVLLGTGTATSGAETDTVVNVEAVFGGSGADDLTGTDTDQQFIGGGGADKIVALGGKDVIDARDGVKDTIDCGAGADTALIDQLDVVVGCETVHEKQTDGGADDKAPVPPKLADLPEPPNPPELPEDEPAAPQPDPVVPAPPAPSAPNPAPTPAGSAPAPGQAGGAPSTGSDRTAPTLRGLHLSKARIGRRGATMLRFTLTEPAAVVVAVERCAATRRATKRCALPTRVATLRRAKLSGAAAVRLTRRFPERTLRAGRYRLKVTAIDAAGNRSVAGTKILRVTGR